MSFNLFSFLAVEPLLAPPLKVKTGEQSHTDTEAILQGTTPLHLIRCRDWQSQATSVEGGVGRSTGQPAVPIQHGPLKEPNFKSERAAMEDTIKIQTRLAFRLSCLGSHKIALTYFLSPSAPTSKFYKDEMRLIVLFSNASDLNKEFCKITNPPAFLA